MDLTFILMLAICLLPSFQTISAAVLEIFFILYNFVWTLVIFFEGASKMVDEEGGDFVFASR